MIKLIAQAIDELKKTWHDAKVSTTEHEDGSVDVLVSPVTIGDQYVPAETWVGFRLGPSYPDADVYPHFIGRVTRKNGEQMGESFSLCEWNGREAIQVSRRTNGWNGATDTAEGKLLKVLTWIRGRT